MNLSSLAFAELSQILKQLPAGNRWFVCFSLFICIADASAKQLPVGVMFAYQPFQKRGVPGGQRIPPFFNLVKMGVCSSRRMLECVKGLASDIDSFLLDFSIDFLADISNLPVACRLGHLSSATDFFEYIFWQSKAG